MNDKYDASIDVGVEVKETPSKSKQKKKRRRKRSGSISSIHSTSSVDDGTLHAVATDGEGGERAKSAAADSPHSTNADGSINNGGTENSTSLQPDINSKYCHACVRELPREKFSKRQWQSKHKQRRCKKCIDDNKEVVAGTPISSGADGLSNDGRSPEAEHSKTQTVSILDYTTPQKSPPKSESVAPHEDNRDTENGVSTEKKKKKRKKKKRESNVYDASDEKTPSKPAAPEGEKVQTTPLPPPAPLKGVFIKERSNLPVYQHRAEICNLVSKNDVVLVVAETVSILHCHAVLHLFKLLSSSL